MFFFLTLRLFTSSKMKIPGNFSRVINQKNKTKKVSKRAPDFALINNQNIKALTIDPTMSIPSLFSHNRQDSVYDFNQNWSNDQRTHFAICQVARNGSGLKLMRISRRTQDRTPSTLDFFEILTCPLRSIRDANRERSVLSHTDLSWS